MSSPSNFANTTTANPAPIDLNVCDLWDASFIMNLAMTGIAVLAYGYFYFHKHLPVRDGVPSYSYPYTILFFLALLLWWQSVPNWAFFVTFYELSGSVAYGEAIACQGNTPPSVGFYLATLILLLALRMNPLDDSRIFGETYVANSPAIAANQPGKRPVNILFVGSANRGLVFAEATRVLLQKRAEGKTIILHVLNTTTDGNAEQHIRNNAFALNRHLLSGSPATTLPILSASSPTALSSSSALDAMLWGMDQNTLEPIQRGYVFRDEREMSSLNMCFDEVWISPRFRDTLASFFMKDEEKSRRLKALVSYVVRRHTVVGASVVYIDKCLGALAAAEDLRETTFFHVNDVSPYAVMQDQREAFDRQSLPDANGRVGGGIKVPTTVVMGILEGVETSAPSFRKRTKMFMVQAVVTRTAPLYTPEALVQVTDGACTLDVLMTTSPASARPCRRPLTAGHLGLVSRHAPAVLGVCRHVLPPSALVVRAGRARAARRELLELPHQQRVAELRCSVLPHGGLLLPHGTLREAWRRLAPAGPCQLGDRGWHCHPCLERVCGAHQPPELHRRHYPLVCVNERQRSRGNHHYCAGRRDCWARHFPTEMVPPPALHRSRLRPAVQGGGALASVGGPRSRLQVHRSRTIQEFR